MNAWDAPGWLQQAGEWIDAGLRQVGAEPAGPVELRKARPWSCVLELPTSRGRVFMKAVSPATGHEPALLDAFARLEVPGVLRPLAVDLERGWLLLPDGGRELRQERDREREFELWELALATYARLQIAVSAHADELVAAGCPDARLARTGQLLEGLAPTRRREIDARVAALRERLEVIAIPASIQHDDLHGGNILISNRGPVVFDWGDASVAHPFMSLTVAFSALVWGHELTRDDPRFDRLRRAYLEPWAGFGDPEALVDVLAAAISLGQLWRAFTYQRLADALPKPLHPIIAGGADGWTDQFMEAD